MAVARVHHTSNYTVISNNIFRNRDLSLKAKGLLCCMLSMPDEWDFNLQGLATTTTDGITAVRSAMHELEDLGYVQRKRIYIDGKIADWQYDIYEEPTLDKQALENLPSENLTVEKGGIYKVSNKSNTKRIKEEKNKVKKKGSKKVDFVISVYHEHCPSLPKIRTVTSKRKTAIEKLLQKYSMVEIIESFDIAEKSKFLTGDNDRGWKADLDFILREDKFISILEGKYSNRRKSIEDHLVHKTLSKEAKERRKENVKKGKGRIY